MANLTTTVTDLTTPVVDLTTPVETLTIPVAFNTAVYHSYPKVQPTAAARVPP